MASRLLSRSKTLALTLIPRSPLRPSLSPSPMDPIASASCSQSLRCLQSLAFVARSHSSDSTSTPAISSILGSPKNFGYEGTLSRWYSVKAQGEPISQIYHSTEKKEIVKAASSTTAEAVIEPDGHLSEKEVICFSPLEASSTKTESGLVKESLKIKGMEVSQKITFALIPALVLISKSSLSTSLLIFCVYWQIYGFFKEIFLDYVHHEASRAWVLVYFKLLLLILAKDTIINFGLV